MRKSVFVIDDSATMRKVFEMTFAGEDIGVVTHEGVSGALARARELRPNAILVDVNLGDGSSYDLVKSLRTDGALGSVPVYMLYSDHSPLDESLARGAGAMGAVLKPFDTQAMIDRVRQAVSGVAPAVAPSVPPAAPKPAVAAAPVAAPVAPAPRAAPPAPPAASMRAPTPAPVAAPKPAPAAVKPAAVSPDDLLPEPAEVAPAPSPLVQAVAAQVHAKVGSLGLTPAQVEAVTALTREVVERVVWEVVPQLAETLIREELKRLTAP